MKKSIIRLTESDLHRIISESVRRILKEDEAQYGGEYDGQEESDDSYDEQGYDNETDYDHNGSNDIDEKVDDICYEFGDGPVLIQGTLHLWDGEHVIKPVRCNDIRTAINKCIGKDGKIMRSNNIEYDGHVVNLIVSHHDGRNMFRLYHE